MDAPESAGLGVVRQQVGAKPAHMSLRGSEVAMLG
jgi:hypothetical protein